MATFLRRLFLLAMAALILPYAEARGQGFSLDYTKPIVFEGQTVYTLQGTPPPGSQITAVKWRWSQTGPNCTSNPIPWVGGGMSQAVSETIPGDFSIECQVTTSTMPTSGNPNPVTTTQTVTTNVSVPAPDGIILPVQQFKDFPNNNTATVQFVFKVTAGGNPVYGLYGCTAKENLTNRRILARIDPSGNPIYKPLPDLLGVGDANLLAISGDSILDTKAFTGPGLANPRIPNGTVLNQLRQQLIVRTKDLCGNDHDWPLAPGFSVTYIKKDAQTIRVYVTK